MLALWLLTVALAQDAPSAYRHHLDQARFFLTREWHEDARNELEAAADDPYGHLDPEVWYMLAQVRLVQADLDGARRAAERAHTYSTNEAQVQAASSLASYLRDSFGQLEVDAPRKLRGRDVDLAREDLILDPTLREIFESATHRLENPTSFPIRVSLPIGRYRVEGVPVDVRPNERSTIDLGEIKGIRRAHSKRHTPHSP